jgi:hypothetical protein
VFEAIFVTSNTLPSPNRPARSALLRAIVGLVILTLTVTGGAWLLHASIELDAANAAVTSAATE